MLLHAAQLSSTGCFVRQDAVSLAAYVRRAPSLEVSGGKGAAVVQRHSKRRGKRQAALSYGQHSLQADFSYEQLGGNGQLPQQQHKVRLTLTQLFHLKAVAASKTWDEVIAITGVHRYRTLETLKGLEEEVGLQLIQGGQGGKGERTHLTGAGVLLLRYADRLLALAADAFVATQDLHAVKTGSVYLAASQTTGIHLLPTLIAAFKRKHPDVLMHMQVENTRRCCLAVSRGEVDLAVVGGQVPIDLEHILQVTDYQEDEVVLAVPSDHALAGRAQISKAELGALRFVALHESSTVRGIAATLEAHGIDWASLHVTMEANSVEAIMRAVEAGLGAAFVSKSVAAAPLHAGRISILRLEGVEMRRRLVCVTDPTRYCPRAVRAFMREMFGLRLDAMPEACVPAPLREEEREQGKGAGERHERYGRHHPSLQSSALSLEDLERATPPNDAEGHPAESSGGGPHNTVAGGRDQMPFTLAQLAKFNKVALMESISAAAIDLSISQPAMSKAIQALEQDLGVELLERRVQGIYSVKLTEAGQALLPYSEAMLGVAEEACRAMADLKAARAGAVSLGASQTVGTYVLPPLIAAFRVRNPKVTLQLFVEPSRRVCSAVARGDVDVAVIGGDVPAELQHVLQVSTYAEDELAFCVPPEHPLAARREIDIRELYEVPLVSLNKGSTVQVVQEKLLRQHGILWRNLRIDTEFNSMEAIKMAVHQGLGAAFVSVSAIEKELQLGLLARVRIRGVRLTRTLSLVSHLHRLPSPAARKFMMEAFGMTPTDERHLGPPLILFRSTRRVTLPWQR